MKVVEDTDKGRRTIYIGEVRGCTSFESSSNGVSIGEFGQVGGLKE